MEAHRGIFSINVWSWIRSVLLKHISCSFSPIEPWLTSHSNLGPHAVNLFGIKLNWKLWSLSPCNALQLQLGGQFTAWCPRWSISGVQSTDLSSSAPLFSSYWPVLPAKVGRAAEPLEIKWTRLILKNSQRRHFIRD